MDVLPVCAWSPQKPDEAVESPGNWDYRQLLAAMWAVGILTQFLWKNSQCS